jgi:hypothetical protein
MKDRAELVQQTAYLYLISLLQTKAITRWGTFKLHNTPI